MSDSFSLSDLERRMDGALTALKKDFSGLRTGRASAALLEPLQVDAYGSKMPITQVGNVSAPEPRLLTVQVWDGSMVTAVEKAIRDSNLGLSPSVDGQLVRVALPELNEERRAELAKVAGKYAEQGKVAVRNVRRDGMEQLKKDEKEGSIGKDEQHGLSAQVQELTDKFVNEIDTLFAQKEEEIMQV